MKQSDFGLFPKDLRDMSFRKSLAELSATKSKLEEDKKYCIEPTSSAGMVQALDFDAVKEHWRDGKFVFKGKSADALIVDGSEYYLIEFKTGRIVADDLLRKVYDSAMALVEYNVLTWDQCKQHLTFVLVGTEVETRLAHLRKKSVADYTNPSYSGVNQDPRTVVGQVVKGFEIYTPAEFEAFAEGKNW